MAKNEDCQSKHYIVDGTGFVQSTMEQLNILLYIILDQNNRRAIDYELLWKFMFCLLFGDDFTQTLSICKKY